MVLALSSITIAADRPARLALVTASPGTADAVAVLTAALSTDSRLALLERAEIDRIYAEQRLATTAAGGSNDPIQLGRLLGPDGLLLFETLGNGPNATLRL